MQKFVVRLMSTTGELLAWATVWAEPKPQGRRAASCPFWPKAPTQFVIEMSGRAASISVHWCDLDIARVNRLMEPADVIAGQMFNFTWTEPVWLVAGMKDVPLPPVTERQPVSIAVPTGALVAAGL